MPAAFFDKNSGGYKKRKILKSPKENKTPKRQKPDDSQGIPSEIAEQQRFFINIPEDRKALSVASDFEYIDQYTGAEDQYKNVFISQKFKKFNNQFDNLNAFIAPVARLQGTGKGAYAGKSFQFNGKPLPLGVYWGEISNAIPSDLSYVFGLGDESVDAKLKGNWTRFVNHSQNNYNVIAQRKYLVINNIKLPYIQYSLIKDVKFGDQFLFDYGDGYQFGHNKRLFLNPCDREESPAEVWKKNEKQYEPKPITFGAVNSKNWRPFMLPSKFFYAPKFLKLALEDTNKLNEYIKNNDFYLDLPILFVDKNKELLSIDKQPGITALMVAAYQGKIDAVRVLVAHGASIEQQHAFTGHTALFYAIQNQNVNGGKEDVIAYLIRNGAKLTTQDKNGLTPVHWCVKNNDLSSLSLLYKNPTRDAILALDRITDKEGLCPIMYALQLNNTRLLKFLQEQYDKTHPRKFFHLNDSWFCDALVTVISSNKNLNHVIFDRIMSQGLKDNNVALMRILPHLMDKGIRITGSPKKTSLDLTFIFPDGETLSYNVKQTKALKKFLSAVPDKDEIKLGIQNQKHKQTSLKKMGLFAPKESVIATPDASLSLTNEVSLK